jgi:hypothetical protein
MQDSIIVYRNPVEKMFWEGGGMQIMGAFLIAFLVAFGITFGIIRLFYRKQWNPPMWTATVPICIGIVAGLFAAWHTL